MGAGGPFCGRFAAAMRPPHTWKNTFFPARRRPPVGGACGAAGGPAAVELETRDSGANNLHDVKFWRIRKEAE